MPYFLQIALALLALTLPCRAQSWDTLRGLKPGDPVRVRDTSGKQRKGSFVSVSADSLAFRTGSTDVALDRAQVRRVQLRSSKRRLRNALIGTGIGLAAGLVIDQTLGALFRNESSQDDGARALTYLGPAAIFGGIGAAAGGSYRTIYKAP